MLVAELFWKQRQFQTIQEQISDAHRLPIGFRKVQLIDRSVDVVSVLQVPSALAPKVVRIFRASIKKGCFREQRSSPSADTHSNIARSQEKCGVAREPSD